MSFFSRRPKAADANAAAAVVASDAPAPAPAPERTGLRGLIARRGQQPATEEKVVASNDDPNPRPMFGQWLKGAIIDIIVMAIVGAVALGIHFAAPMRHNAFPVSHPNGNTISPSLAYPLRKPLLPTYASAILSTLLPFVLILLIHPRARSLATTATALLGLLHALLLSALAQVTLKPLLAAPRPHFLTVCDPATPPYGSQSGIGFNQIMYDRRVYRGVHGAVSEALKSFPSGTATAAFAGLGFLALYLNAQLRVFGNVRAGALKLLAVWVPLLGAALLAGARVAAGWNHWYDVVAGAVVGLLAAVGTYRGCFASVWDFRFNCVPLVRGVGYRYGTGRQEGFEVREERDAHGHVHEHLGGAPFDAMALPGPTVVDGDGTAAGTAGSVPTGEERGKERVPRKAVGSGLFRRGDENV